MWSLLVIILSVVSGNAMNRPVYKIVLTQKGFAQFLQYDVETPPLREFTFCTWIRIYDLGNDQSIFTYVARGNKRLMRLWLDSGGYMRISINGKVTSSIQVDLVKDVWKHVCLSYQSDFGAWALYIDSRLASCEAAQSLHGFILPGGGSVIIGYGTADNGAANGLEGEIFGANMILISTIERIYTTRQDPSYKQKLFRKNKIKTSNDHINYVVLSDLQTDEIHNNFEKTRSPYPNTTRSFIKVKTPFSYLEHDVGLELSSIKPDIADKSNEKEILDFGVDAFRTTDKDRINFWNIVNQGHDGKFREQTKTEQSGSGTRDLPMISEYETPPPPPMSSNQLFVGKTFEVDKTPSTASIYKIHEDSNKLEKKFLVKKHMKEISEYETPPPLDTNTNVYGQWTSSKFAGNVLNYLKSINFQNKEPRKVPKTIPLTRLTDTYPYASDFKVTKLRPPAQFQRRNLVEKRYDINKRDPQINVQILEDDLRSNILKLHAQTQPQNVEIINRGTTRRQNKDHRFYRNVESNYDSTEILASSDEKFQLRPTEIPSKIKNNHKYSSNFDFQSHNLMSILPFLKSLEYFIEDTDITKTEKKENNDDMYSKSLSKGNKWHNVKSYNNDYTPSKLYSDHSQSVKKKYPSIKLKYIPDNHKVVEDDDATILQGRELAMTVSNHSEHSKDSISILKYNHGYLPGHDRNTKDKHNSTSKMKHHGVSGKNNFDKHVKIGNALSERHLIGSDDKQKKSFIGGDESVPDINRYRSDIEDNYELKVPPSLGPRVCKNVELHDRVLYVQQDESIDMTHILSPVRAKNIAMEFVLQNYKKCSLKESTLEKNLMLLIDWSKTPVRLFGGAYPKTTTDLCGFF